MTGGIWQCSFGRSTKAHSLFRAVHVTTGAELAARHFGQIHPTFVRPCVSVYTIIYLYVFGETRTKTLQALGGAIQGTT